ncbi:DUF2764 family protein [bacterium]|nr:DUF2764 family protein [bacterium]
MGKNYYYLVSSLPTLNFSEFDSVPVAELLEKISDNLEDADLKNLNFLRKERDIRNLHSVKEDWQTFRNLGNIPAAAFGNSEIELDLPEDWDRYVLSQQGEKPVSIDTVWLAYFDAAAKLNNDFVSAWVQHEQALRVALAVVRQEKQKSGAQKTVSDVIEKSEDQIIQEILNNTRLPNFGVGYLFDWADSVRDVVNQNNPQEAELALDRIRWDFLENWTANRHFAGEVVLAYALKLFICERWQRLDLKTGEQIIQTILGGNSGE